MFVGVVTKGSDMTSTLSVAKPCRTKRRAEDKVKDALTLEMVRRWPQVCKIVRNDDGVFQLMGRVCGGELPPIYMEGWVEKCTIV